MKVTILQSNQLRGAQVKKLETTSLDLSVDVCYTHWKTNLIIPNLKIEPLKPRSRINKSK